MTWRVIGIGNPYRGDDGAGPAVVAALQGTPGLELRRCRGEGLDVLDALDGAARAVLVDAAVGAAPGRVRGYDVARHPLPAGVLATSSHGLALAEMLELARAIGLLPPVCRLYAIAGAAFAPGAPLSAPVLAAVAALAQRLATLAAELGDA